MKLTGLNLIGCDQSGKGNLSFQAINPFTQRPLETVFMEATNPLDIWRLVDGRFTKEKI